jgi:hypothetical protein
MRKLILGCAMSLVLAACETQVDTAAPDASAVTAMLKSNDPSVCGVGEVQTTALNAAANDYQDFINKGGKPIKFTVVSATDMNKDIHEVTCSAELDSDHPFKSIDNGNRMGAITYKVRPALDGENQYIVETLGDNVAGLILLHITANTKNDPAAQTAANSEPIMEDVAASPVGQEEQAYETETAQEPADQAEIEAENAM